MQPNGIRAVYLPATPGNPRSQTSAITQMTRRRFQVVVLSAYKQIRAQNISVLSDIDEDNYDRAFAFFRPGQDPEAVL